MLLAALPPSGQAVRVTGALVASASEAVLVEALDPGGVPAPQARQVKLRAPLRDAALYCIVNPRADRHRPRRDRRQRPLLPRPRICVRQMRLVPEPWLKCRDTTTRCQSKSCQLSKVRDCPTTASGCLDNHL